MIHGLVHAIGATSAGAAAAPVYSQLVTPVLNMPGSDDALAGGTEIWVASYDRIPLLGPCNDLQMFFSTVKVTGAATEGNWGGGGVFEAAVEYPFGSGTYYPVTWAAAATKTLNGTTAFGGWCDPVSIPGGFATEVGLATRVQLSSAFLMSYSKIRSSSGKVLTGTSGVYPAVADQSSLGAGKAWVVMPTLMKGTMSAKMAADVYIGDSNMVDQAHNADSWGLSGFPRELNGARGCTKMTVTGINLSAQYNNFTRRAAIIAQIPNAQVNCHVLLGTNDLKAQNASNNATPNNPPLTSQTTTLFAALHAIGPQVKVHGLTLPPKGDATQSGANGLSPDDANAQAFNADLINLVCGNDGAYDLRTQIAAPFLASDGKWGTSSGSANTVDWLHVNFSNANVRNAEITARQAWRTANGL